MTYDQILSLVTIVEAGSFKAASEVLSKTQPSISMAIRKLEEEYQIQLFDRSDYRPKLTEQGEIFYSLAKENLKSFSKLDKLATELGLGVEPKICLSLEAIVPIKNIRSVLSKFNQNVFATQLEVSVDIIEGAVEKVVDGQVDLAIGPLLGESSDLEVIKLFDVSMIPVMTRENVMGYMSTIEELKNLPQLVVRSTSKHRSDNGSGLLDGGKKWFLGDNSLKKSMIVNGLGWGKLPLHDCQDELLNQKLIEIPFEEVKRIEVPLYLMKRKDKALGKNARKLWDELIHCGEKYDKR